MEGDAKGCFHISVRVENPIIGPIFGIGELGTSDKSIADSALAPADKSTAARNDVGSGLA
jgi:hypothetical protein